MSEWTLNTDSMGRLTITVEGEEWEKAVDKSFRKIAREIELPGFRKGKAPKNMLLKRLNMQSVYYEAFKTNIDSWLGKAFLEHNLKVISQPQVVGTPSFNVYTPVASLKLAKSAVV
jgi:trigger factor